MKTETKAYHNCDALPETIETKAEHRPNEYQAELDARIADLTDWIIDQRGWSRLVCAGELAHAVNLEYKRMNNGHGVGAPETKSRREGRMRRKIVFEHDEYPDFSWLKQGVYNPASPDYTPVYRTREDMDAGRKPLDADWFRDPNNHVALSMLVYEMDEDDEDWRLVDSLGNIDFMADSDDWKTGAFYHAKDLPEGYLKQLAQEAGIE